ncbi:hypothetical protein [Sphingobium lactosutens]|nr:hypothetical protein [Sphingobium lactosutens]
MTTTTFHSRVPGGGTAGGDARAKGWERFAAMACNALRDAADILGSYGLGFDHTALDGYWASGSRKAKGSDVVLPMENGITDPLVRALELVRAAAPPEHLISRYQVCFVQQQPRKKQNKLGSKAYTTDIQVRSLVVPDLDLRIEAKVLFGGGDVAAYCGKNGLLRFADAEPYTDQHVGMMLGYSVRRDDAHWFKEIQKTATSLTAVGPFEMLDLDGGRVTGSLVNSHATGQVLVLHMLLPFETNPSARAIDAAPKEKKPK